MSFKGLGNEEEDYGCKSTESLSETFVTLC